MGDNISKGMLIPHTSYGRKQGITCDLARIDEPQSDELVGGVKAYQGDDL